MHGHEFINKKKKSVFNFLYVLSILLSIINTTTNITHLTIWNLNSYHHKSFLISSISSFDNFDGFDNFGSSSSSFDSWAVKISLSFDNKLSISLCDNLFNVDSDSNNVFLGDLLLLLSKSELLFDFLR